MKNTSAGAKRKSPKLKEEQGTLRDSPRFSFFFTILNGQKHRGPARPDGREHNFCLELSQRRIVFSQDLQVELKKAMMFSGGDTGFAFSGQRLRCQSGLTAIFNLPWNFEGFS